MKIIVCDPVSPKGIALLKEQPEFEVVVLEKRHSEEELLPLVADAAALVVRSETKITRKVMEAAGSLRVVGRAGVGVDNVDVAAATAHGVVVMNTPGGNTISTAELAFSLIMSLARKIPMAHASMKAGKWDRKLYKGSELNGKTLGILGLGRIGSEVSRRALTFGMTVLAYDPYLSHARAKALQVELVERPEDLYPRVDFLTVHLPMSEETNGMVHAAAMNSMKRGVCIVNCARGGIVHESDLLAALESGQVAGAALDVYTTEPLPADSPLRSAPNLIMTPHLGASTSEAQDNVGIEVAEAITDFLRDGTVRNAVNLPSMDARTFEQVRPYLNLGEKLGRLLAQITPRRNDRLVITYGGKATALPGDPISRAVLKGFLQNAAGTEVNTVNVRNLANSLGLLVEEVKSNEETDFQEWVHVSAWAGEERRSVGGTFFSAQMLPRIVRMNSQPVEIVPEGVLLLLNNTDRPGMVGHIGSILGRASVNIASMSLHRDEAGGRALSVLNLDSVPPKAALEELRNDPAITNLHVVQL
ncbi:MAG: phosphoglycerate dehydrogenase [Verrucomicrobiales bacterium]|nr:phosphoglycerate dehydrogenase [Verrucomicrobiales bacterium]MCP5525392.1 phosphoglycerate dehydrogenase [Verrucomicrobiales bacterium]